MEKDGRKELYHFKVWLCNSNWHRLALCLSLLNANNCAPCLAINLIFQSEFGILVGARGGNSRRGKMIGLKTQRERGLGRGAAKGGVVAGNVVGKVGWRGILWGNGQSWLMREAMTPKLMLVTLLPRCLEASRNALKFKEKGKIVLLCCEVGKIANLVITGLKDMSNSGWTIKCTWLLCKLPGWVSEADDFRSSESGERLANVYIVGF